MIRSRSVGGAALPGAINLRLCELRSVTRSQLNIKIDPELLQRLRSHATRQGTTLTEFVASVLAKAISGDEHLSLEERVSRIEEHLGL
jgi:uncharacterized protein (DUF1778 family)